MSPCSPQKGQTGPRTLPAVCPELWPFPGGPRSPSSHLTYACQAQALLLPVTAPTEDVGS